MEDGCEASLLHAWIPASAKILLPPGTTAGSIALRDLRNCKHVVIPEGTDKLGNYWFWGSDIESVTIPVSVREICLEVFCDCRSLRHVAFAPGSMLERIGSGSFSSTKIEKIVISKGVTEIRECAFENCEHLKQVVFEESSELQIIGEHAFNGC